MTRQKNLQKLCNKHGWNFDPAIDWQPKEESDFHFFATRPVEYVENTITGVFPSNNSDWLVEDVTFDEGAFFASEEHHMTILTIHLPFEIPTFALEKARWIDRILEIAGYEEADAARIREVVANGARGM